MACSDRNRSVCPYRLSEWRHGRMLGGMVCCIPNSGPRLRYYSRNRHRHARTAQDGLHLVRLVGVWDSFASGEPLVRICDTTGLRCGFVGYRPSLRLHKMGRGSMGCMRQLQGRVRSSYRKSSSTTPLTSWEGHSTTNGPSQRTYNTKPLAAFEPCCRHYIQYIFQFPGQGYMALLGSFVNSLAQS
jgi:hypothetical protein